MANYQTVGDYLTVAKSLCNDVDTVRYTQQQYMDALNTGVLEGFRTRPDFFRGGEDTIPNYTVGGEAVSITWPKQYAMVLVLFITGFMELIDAEGNEDQRAAVLLSTYTAKLAKPGI